MTVEKSEAKALMESLRGKSIKIPDLWPVYQGWSMGINKHHPQMVPVVDKRIEDLGFTGKKLDRLKRADFGMITGVWWPQAEWEEYRILTYIIMWLFIWDDLFEQLVSDPTAGPEGAEAYRRETVEFVYRSLGFGSGDIYRPDEPLINSFDVIGEALCIAYNEEQRHSFLKALEGFFASTQLEQEMRLGERVPTLEEFWIMRMGTIGVEPCLAMNEYALKKRLPSRIMRDRNMKILWDESIAGLSIVNDIFSMKKEMVGGTVLNLVPVTYAACNDPQMAIDASVQCLGYSVENVRAASANLLALTEEGSEERQALMEYIELVTQHSTGNLYWSLRTQRYGMAPYTGDDGVVSLTL